MLSVQNLNKSYEVHNIFNDASFALNLSEKIGLVGRNGYGKSTLFKLLTGEEESDSGKIIIAKNYKIGYLKQELIFHKDTVLEEALLGLDSHDEKEEWKVKKVLMGLGFLENDFLKKINQFSGGFQVRLNLVKTLVSDPNLLLLDEPTNFLDILSIRWLTKFLQEWKKELIIISHDRGFIDSIVSHILGIHRQKIRKIKGKTEDYYNQINFEEEIYENKRLNDEKLKKQRQVFISKFRAKARHANLVQSRIKNLEKQEVFEKKENIKNLDFKFNYFECKAKVLFEAFNLSFSYSNELPALIDNFNLKIEKNDRICVIGKNGKGKTTLLKLLGGELKPLNGAIKMHSLLKFAFFEQSNTALLNGENTVEEEILLSSPEKERKRIRDLCGLMLFSGDSALKRINVLSGGEKCRVLITKLLVAPINLLLLDEPTHHLDIESTEAFVKALEEFKGASIIVTHSEEILKRYASKLIIFKDDGIINFNGTYNDFLEKIGWDDIEALTDNKITYDKSKLKENKKNIKRDKAELIVKRSKLFTPYIKKIEKIENEINECELELENENQNLINASSNNNPSQISKSALNVSNLKKELEKLYIYWEKINLEFEEKKEEFENSI